MIIRGIAVLVSGGTDYETGINLLRQKYPQYATVLLDGNPIIIVTPTAIRGWRATTSKDV